MASLRRHPFKLVWYERYPPELFDLRWDPHERSDLASRVPDIARRLGSELAEHIRFIWRKYLRVGPRTGAPQHPTER